MLIANEINGDIIATQVRLERASHQGCFLLVEGDSDSTVFSRFCDFCSCSIIVCNGKENLFDAVHKLSSDKIQDALGFADRDYSNFLVGPLMQGDVVLTDENDLEIMILHSDAMEKILDEFGNQGKISAVQLKENRTVLDLIFASAQVVGELRLLSQERDLELKFSRMKFFFRKGPGFSLDLQRTIEHVVSRSDKRSSISIDKLTDEVDVKISKRVSAKEVCCGHDCVRVLAKALKSSIGSDSQFDSERGTETLESALRLAYEYEYFKSTNAYFSIKAWENKSGLTVLR